MTSPDRAVLRDLSQAAFGQSYRLELMLAVADSEDGIVCLTDLARELDVSISNLQGPLRSMVRAGLLAPLPHGDSRRRFYIRNASSAWKWAQELRDQARSANAQRAELDHRESYRLRDLNT